MEQDGSNALQPLAVTVTRAAQLLSLGRSTFYAYVKAGHVRTIPAGNDQRVPMSEIERLAREGLPPLPKKQAA